MDKNLENKWKEWKEKTLNPSLEKFKERWDKFETHSEIPIERLYVDDYIPEEVYSKDLGFPGEYPFTRGVQPTMYRGRFWTMRQYAGFSSAEESNKRYRYLLDHGQTGLSIAFDLPTQIGYSSDHQLAEGEVGKVGVAIDSLEDMERLLDSIPLDKVSTSMTINATASILLAMYIVVAKKQGVATDQLRGTIQNDILKEYVARGTHRFPVQPSMRLITDIFSFCKEQVPRWNTISISGYHMREAGCTAVQEVAFTLANGIAYVQAAIDAGLEVDSFANRLSFFFNAHNNLFEEIAKFRAARRLWAKIMKERFGAKKDDSCRLRFHTQTAGSTLTYQQHENNVIRVTLQALAAVLGGTQSLHTNSKDEAHSLPSEEAVRIALRTQQIIAYESGAGDTVDPLGGAPFVETLTNEIETRATDYIKIIDDMGGAVKAVENGYMQKEIQNSAYKYQVEIDNNKNIVVGVNKFQSDEKPTEDILRVDEMVRNKQIERINQLKQKRDNSACEHALTTLKLKAKTDENLIPYIIAAVENYATIGEICESLEKVFGTYDAIYM